MNRAFEKFIADTDLNKFKEVYQDPNNTFEDIAKYFGIGIRLMKRVAAFLNLPEDRQVDYSWNKVLQKVDKEKFCNMYLDKENYSQEDIMREFQISDATCRRLRDQWNLEGRCHKQDLEEDILSKYSVEEIRDYYSTHSRKETWSEFEITDGNLAKLVRENSLYKTEEEIKLINKKASELKDHKAAREKAAQTCLEKFGVTSVLALPETYEKNKESVIAKYGSLEAFYKYRGQALKDRYAKQPKKEGAWWNKDGSIRQSILDEYGSLEEFQKARIAKTQATKSERYGDPYYTNREKAVETCMERYGVPYVPLSVNPINAHGCKDSKPNSAFKKKLEEHSIEHTREFIIKQFKYDFKVNNNLIEINPSATHNINWSPYGDHVSRISKDYHYNKTKIARENDYRCIHVWDWDDEEKIINLLLPKEKLYARKCAIKEVSKEEASNFINKHHLQNYCKDEIRIGLYYNDNLVSIMTFGKARYNKKYQHELLRYCSSYNVIGGAEKLFNYFIKTYDPESIVSYCDWSKFDGHTYLKLGFKFKNYSIGKHWYNMYTGQHVTNNLLLARGYDQLFGTNFGKGTSNEELMLKDGFVEIYDAGQAAFGWTRPQ